ncbi:MAG TPA: peptidylprolyl isomerase [Candidatus Eisenbacteria bacterium]|nr:peptidylprolyl isomerase [Candidatus Eisenbacteria bacterium]
MEKVILFVMILGVGVASVILLLSKSSQPTSTALDLLNATPTVSALEQQQQAAQQQQQQAQPKTQPIGPVEVLAPKQATISTSKGDITVQLYATEAAQTVNNFAQRAKAGFYKGLIFHRVEDWVVQGGDPLGNGTGGGQMATEINNEPFEVGSLGVARGNDIQISNDSQFFITKTAASWLNNQYTNFGKVTSGMSVVNKLQIGDKILGITTSN